MKILFVDTDQTGHHPKYLSALVSLDIEACVAIPKGSTVGSLPNDRIFYYEYGNRTFLSYLRMLKELRQIAWDFKPDIIHFLNGDSLYRFFGIGLRQIYNSRIVVTCHQFRRSFVRDISYRCISRNCDAFVVHTDKLLSDMVEMGLSNVFHIEYPQFGNSVIMNRNEALLKLGIGDRKEKVLLALGETRIKKGLDILLEALQGVNENFHLIIAGKEEDFQREFIEQRVESYRQNVTLFLEYLSDEKFALCLNASDVVVLPYRKTFDGASGPLGEGVWLYKEIVGPDHKSLGKLITSNHLGKTFVSEDVDDLRKVLCSVIMSGWVPDERYLEYRQSLNPAFFQEKYRKLYNTLIAK